MTLVKCFKAKRDTPSINKNQKVWIRFDHQNFYTIRFKYRGSGRYVTACMDKQSSVIGDIKEFEVDDGFAKRILGR